MGFPEEAMLLALPWTQPCWPEGEKDTALWAVRMAHLTIIITVEYVCHFLVAKHRVLINPIFTAANKEVIRSQAKLGILSF